MNPFEVLQIPPTQDKMAIRRAFVAECKKHHPDANGSDGVQLQRIQEAYETLVNHDLRAEVIETSVTLELKDFLYGCVAQAVILKGPLRGAEIEFRVPPYTYPGDTIEFFDKRSTRKTIRVKLHENTKSGHVRLGANIVIKRSINVLEAELGKTIQVRNFDGRDYQVKISPETTADRLVFTFNNAGFYEKNTETRQQLTVIVSVEQEGT